MGCLDKLDHQWILGLKVLGAWYLAGQANVGDTLFSSPQVVLTAFGKGTDLLPDELRCRSVSVPTGTTSVQGKWYSDPG